MIRKAGATVSNRWLVLALVLGLILGIAQQLRGAHYMSHTLWTAWICWTFGLLVDVACGFHYRRRDSVPQSQSEQKVQA